jgi:hypothetical protein
MKEGLGVGLGEYGPIFVGPQSQYAEHNWYHVSKREYLFADPGTCKVRAIAKTSSGLLISNECEIKVTARSPAHLERIGDMGTASYGLETTLKWDSGEVLMAIQDVGGNLGTTIRNRNLVREYLRRGTIDGKAVLPNQLCDVLQKQLDEVSYGNALDELIDYYVAKRDPDGHAPVLNAIPHRTKRQSSAARQINSFLKRDDR